MRANIVCRNLNDDRVIPRFSRYLRDHLGWSLTARLTMRRSKAGPLIRVEISPGRFVQCRPEDEEKVREQFAKGRRGRRGYG